MSKKKKILLTSLFAILILAAVGAAAATGQFTKTENNLSSQSQESATILSANERTDSENGITVQNTENQTQPPQPSIVKYTVKAGDTLESIAKAYNVNISTISESNEISNNNSLKTGQELQFPSIVGVLYSIKSGENLWDLAAKYDIDVDDIVGANAIESPEKIKIGQKIILPNVDKIKSANVAAPKSTSASKSTANTSIKSSAASSSLGFIWPTRGRISSGFGPRWGSQHTGVDIAAPTGTNVSAAMGGKVIFSGWKDGYGNLVIINHGNGYETYYAHNSKLLVKSGQAVARGTVIAKVGSTGNSTGPHSHFEIRKNGVSVNPLNYLK